MDWLLIVLRIAHVGGAMIWFGGTTVSAFFLEPTAKALGREAQPFMDHLMNRRRLGLMFPLVAGITILSGIALYWRGSGGLQLSWIASPTGFAFTVGGVAAIFAFIGGMALIVPSVAAQTAVRDELEASGGPRRPSSVGGWSRPSGGPRSRPGSTSRCCSSLA